MALTNIEKKILFERLVDRYGHGKEVEYLEWMAFLVLGRAFDTINDKLNFLVENYGCLVIE